MTLTLDIVEALAPDQAALKAASKQMSAKKWPLRGHNEATDLIWGECQGSGSNPYRVMADVGDQGYKCTCPSRKFPCKHVLALMWMFAESASDFVPGNVPDWVSEWVGRRRKTGTPAAATQTGGIPKNLKEALRTEPEPATDPKRDAKRKAGAEKRAKETLQSVAIGLEELEQWILDQLRQGLGSFVTNAQDRCRRIAARLVDAKAQALASRLDELPARLFSLPTAEQADAAISEFAKLVLLAEAWKTAPGGADVHGCVATSQGRDELLSAGTSIRVAGRWEVLGEQISTRRDGLIAQSTWLLNVTPHEASLRFALLLDFFPAATGRRSSSFVVGQQFSAELTYFPSRQPLRAMIVHRDASDEPPSAWPEAPKTDPLASYWSAMQNEPWLVDAPVLLPPGRLHEVAQMTWWSAVDREVALPVAHKVPAVALGVDYEVMAAIWDGNRCHLLTGVSTDWGRMAFNG